MRVLTLSIFNLSLPSSSSLSHIPRLLQSQNDNPDFVATRLARAAVEGAAQLLTYQAARDYVHQVAPYFEGLRDLQAM